MKKSLLFFCFMLISGLTMAQGTFPVNGSHDERPQLFAFTNATIVVKAGEVIQNGTLLVDGQRIAALGKGQAVPKGYVTIDLQGKFIYPSFIDAFSEYGQPREGRGGGSQGFGGGRQAQIFESTKNGPYGWNEAIRPETAAKETFTVDKRQSEELKKIGFGAVQSVVRDGIARGSSVVATLAEARENEVIILPEAGAHYSFSKGSARTSYPSSLMGTIALIRQTYYDGQWYAKQQDEYNISLEAFNKLQSLPQFFEVDDMLDVLRADKIAKEFGKSYIIKAGGNEYQRIADIKATNASLIVPLNFPKAYDVEDPADARNVTLAQLKHWEMAPANPALLEKAGIRFAISSIGLDNPRDFWSNLRVAIANGLSPDYALRALTEVPAEMLGLSSKLGTLEKGKLANFIIASDTLFKEGTVIYENWVQGKKFVATKSYAKNLTGEYATQLPGVGTAKLFVKENDGRLEAHLTVGNDTTETKVTSSRTGDLLSFSFNPKGQQGSTRISGYIVEEEPLALKGEVVQPDGASSSWTATYTAAYTTKTSGRTRQGGNKSVVEGEILYPFVAYGNKTLPTAETVLIKNATVWTNEADGILENADVLLAGGKIKAVGKNLSASGATVIDGTGKHVTPGIIDEHSHIAISRGVNEGSHSVTSEVRIGDVLNSEDINIYRQLAGGVTASHLLHGSANSIGGQSQLIKLRWGQNPEGLKFGENDGFIKFALGENVKQSNWGITGTRFPQTRMGVEQVFYDAFTRAKEYKARIAANDPALRRDLTLDALVEILDKKRFITCHSYVQSEINMLMHVGDSMGFGVNTFTHILEGYKLADEMASRQIAGASFADWWAYKMEVQEAIPYNAYLMHKRNVLTAINSDDAEMARRLNQEAGKAVKYGGVTEEEALKMVTLNVAEILHVADKVGSLTPGKDADIVIWSDKPLSIYAKAEKTFVDGVKYWDLNEDAVKQQALTAEKARLIRKSLQAKGNGGTTQRAVAQPNMEYHCDTIGEIGEFEEYMD
ncbi:amidohydrolase family protein [Parapedobacter koreensis]|uniref:Imidazolonepropionase n=1 Tax=Parapedobacter koreensis TaxID=332977 RepID=A0A1H7P3H7_9SPHI|nr:amidohydrolase family protein [Parapedobacter koreensis]SEL30371.1 Imidazolonepropionase [Parapedobacter koreensis]